MFETIRTMSSLSRTSVFSHSLVSMWLLSNPSIFSSWPLAGSHASWAYDLSSYEAQRILSLVQDRPMPVSRSQTTAPRSVTSLDDMPRRRASMFVQPQSAPISRSNSELSLHPPMRRRSLIQTPGVATRPHPGPIMSRSTKSSVRHSHPPTPSMSRQPSTHFEESDSDFLPIRPLDIPIGLHSEVSRVATPKDTDYSITGAFKFGTLRITNGSPVLTPNPALSLSNEFQQIKTDGNMRDYFAREADGEGSVTSDRDVDQALASVHFAPPSEMLNAEAVGNQTSSLEAVGETDVTGLSITIPQMCLEGQCTTDLQLNPEKKIQEHPASPLMTQSKQAAVDDYLFEDDTEVSVPEVLDVRVDLSARSFPRQPVDSRLNSEGMARSDSGFVSSSKSDSSQSRSSLAKADSGYSSNVSLRSLRHGRKLATSEEVTGRSSSDSDQGSHKIRRSDSKRVPGVQIPNPAAVDDSHAVGTPPSDKAPTPPPKDDILLKQMCRTSSGPTDMRAAPITPGRTRRKSQYQQPPAIDTSQTVECRELKSPKPLPLSPASATSDGSSSSLSIANSAQKPGRLQRLLSLRNSPFSKQPYTVHETHSVDSKIPSIPKEVEAKLRERTGLYPMTTKRLALKSQMSKETLKTILSVGSLEYSNDDELPPSPTCFDHVDGEEVKTFESGDVKEHSLKQTFTSMQSNFKTAASSMISSKKSIVRKPVPIQEPQNREDDYVCREDMLSMGMELAGYNLGSNAYDSAARSLSTATKPQRSMSMTTRHDHYLQLRTYSLNSRTSSVHTSTESSIHPMNDESQVLPKRKTSPPISMVTRTSFRTPPPRSPSRPQGAAVRRKGSQETVSRSVSHSVALGSGRRLDHWGSVSGGESDNSASAPQIYASTRDSPNRYSSLNSQTHSSVRSRHNSVSSVRSDFVRESRALQLYGQQASGTTLKHQSSLESVGRHQLYGVYVPHSAHQRPTFVPQSRFENPSGHWNPQNGRPMSGQLPWGAPPYVPRGHHRRNLSAGSQPNFNAHSGSGHAPYRILHSYNSPAYRNAPIWG